ncbi:TVP38/TMEM64 family inner membrane protein YdjZ [Gimesia panareensis]|uniref:TVP38/TMEM64 family membrane protein n=1 Tax=Gimesia panareensis TaxID=2527978 RepID=A0A518FW57_9PLAN|nr:TVP38/TMEM64 family protein [Gimesia panareensis]QDV20595.1 TVP38/TMEM64 family inner membrane protein YdjZ [Gimesia panareensis]
MQSDLSEVDPVPHTESTSSPSGQSSYKGRVILLAVLLLTFGLVYWQFGDLLSLEQLSARESSFREYQLKNPWLVYGLAFVAYVVVAGLSLPGAAGMTLLLGWLFGFGRGVVVVSFASTAGASIAFLMSRYLMRDAIQNRFGTRLQTFNSALAKEGAFYLFSLRLIPAVPFFVINVVMGLTPIRLRTFWWVSQLGMLPGTAAYVYAGASVPSLQFIAERGVSSIVSPRILAAFMILGLFPLIAKYSYTFIRKKIGRKSTDKFVDTTE